MASRYNKVSRDLWGDRRVVGWGPPPMHPTTFLLYLLTTERQGPQPGLIRAGAGAISEAVGWEYSEVADMLERLRLDGVVEYSARPPLIWLPNTMNHHSPESPNHAKAWGTWAATMPECDLRTRAVTATWQALRQALREPYRKGYGKPLPKQEQEQEQEQENNNVGSTDEALESEHGAKRNEAPAGASGGGPGTPGGSPGALGRVPPTHRPVGGGQPAPDLGPDRGEGQDSTTGEQLALTNQPPPFDPIGAVWAEYKQHKPRARKVPTSEIQSAIAFFGPPDDIEPREGWEVCRDIIRWAFTSSHERAEFIRDGEHLSLQSLLQNRTREERRMWSGAPQAGTFDGFWKQHGKELREMLVPYRKKGVPVAKAVMVTVSRSEYRIKVWGLDPRKHLGEIAERLA